MTFFSKTPFYKLLLIVEIVSLLFKSSSLFAKTRSPRKIELDVNVSRENEIVDGILARLRDRPSHNVIYLEREDVASHIRVSLG